MKKHEAFPDRPVYRLQVSQRQPDGSNKVAKFQLQRFLDDTPTLHEDELAALLLDMEMAANAGGGLRVHVSVK